MKTTAQWWEEVSTSPERFIDWLKSQYHGERTAASRIQKMMDSVPNDGLKEWRVHLLTKIIMDEMRHASWVGALLKHRGVNNALLVKEERYWKEVLPAAEGKSFEYMCAVGHLAETMRLERIQLLAKDERFKDVAEVFQKILPDEIMHARVFGILSTPEDIEEARKYHNNGMNSLGLLP